MENNNLERYGTQSNWSKVLGLSEPTVKKYLVNEQHIVGADKRGKPQAFYSETNVRKKLALLLQDIPQVDASGFCTWMGKRYGLITAWARELNISSATVSRKMQDMESLKGKDHTGRVREKLYVEADIYKQCSYLIEEMPCADESGFFQQNGIHFGTIGAWAKKFDADPQRFSSRMDADMGTTGKDAGGRIHIKGYFPETHIRESCRDIIEGIPRPKGPKFLSQRDSYGNTFRIGNIPSWSQEFCISIPTIRKNLKGVMEMVGKNEKGKILRGVFYAEHDVRRAIEHLLHDMPRADDEGFFMQQEEKFGTVTAWSRILGLSAPTIIDRLKDHQGVTGKCKGILLIDSFYPEKTVRKVCAQFAEEMPTANESGFFTTTLQDGSAERYGTQNAWRKEFHIAMSTMVKRLAGAEGIKGKTSKNYISQSGFFPESMVRQRCKDLIENIPAVNDDGFIILPNDDTAQRYAAAETWASVLGISKATANRRLSKAMGITGRDQSGRKRENRFYPESLVRELCNDAIFRKNHRK